MSHDMKLRIKSGLLALMVAGGITLVHAPKTMAEEAKPKYKEGTFIDIPSYDEHEESQYGIYVVKEGDNLSRISEKICRHQGVEISTKYWPVLAYLNGYPKVAQPGDLLFFLEDNEDMENTLKDLTKSGWKARYIQKNNVYGKKDDTQSGLTVMALLIDIYGKDVCTDPDFVRKYLKTIGQSGKFNADSVIKNTEEYFKLTDWIPTLDDLGYKPQESTNTK